MQQRLSTILIADLKIAASTMDYLFTRVDCCLLVNHGYSLREISAKVPFKNLNTRRILQPVFSLSISPS